MVVMESNFNLQMDKMSNKHKITLTVQEHIDKYIGDRNNIIMRSNWERDFFEKLLRNPKVKEVCSEGIAIRYFFPQTKTYHNYFPDFYFEMEMSGGNIEKFIVEVKPFSQTQKPPPPKTRRKNSVFKYQREMFVYAKNLAKWEACINYCKKKGFTFLFLTELTKNGKIVGYKLWEWNQIGLPIKLS